MRRRVSRRSIRFIQKSTKIFIRQTREDNITRTCYEVLEPGEKKKVYNKTVHQTKILTETIKECYVSSKKSPDYGITTTCYYADPISDLQDSQFLSGGLPNIIEESETPGYESAFNSNRTFASYKTPSIDPVINLEKDIPDQFRALAKVLPKVGNGVTEVYIKTSTDRSRLKPEEEILPTIKQADSELQNAQDLTTVSSTRVRNTAQNVSASSPAKNSENQTFSAFGAIMHSRSKLSPRPSAADESSTGQVQTVLLEDKVESSNHSKEDNIKIKEHFERKESFGTFGSILHKTTAKKSLQHGLKHMNLTFSGNYNSANRRLINSSCVVPSSPLSTKSKTDLNAIAKMPSREKVNRIPSLRKLLGQEDKRSSSSSIARTTQKDISNKLQNNRSQDKSTDQGKCQNNLFQNSISNKVNAMLRSTKSHERINSGGNFITIAQNNKPSPKTNSPSAKFKPQFHWGLKDHSQKSLKSKTRDHTSFDMDLKGQDGSIFATIEGNK